MRGAQNAVEAVKPDVGIALEVGIATDYPLWKKEFSQEELGAGPAIFAYDSAMIPNHKLSDLFQKLAGRQQDSVANFGGSRNTDQMPRRSRSTRPADRPSTLRFQPATHIFTTGVIDWADLDHAIDLLVRSAGSPR